MHHGTIERAAASLAGNPAATRHRDAVFAQQARTLPALRRQRPIQIRRSRWVRVLLLQSVRAGPGTGADQEIARLGLCHRL